MKPKHDTLVVAALRPKKDFCRALGPRPVVHAPPRHARLVGPMGDATLSIEFSGDAALPARERLYFEFGDVEQPDRRAAQRREPGLQVQQRRTGMDYLRCDARSADADGPRIRLDHAGCHRLDRPSKLRAGELPD